MQKIQQVQSLRQARKQKGFTIIELVVVILLLGILAATALPRFMDVTDEAHSAVVDGLEGSIQTGTALFRAQWIASGQRPGALPGFGDGLLDANLSGYPDASNSTDCTAIYNGLLQAGRPTAAPLLVSLLTGEAALAGAPNITAIEINASVPDTDDIALVADGADVVAFKSQGGSIYCKLDTGTTCLGTTYFDDAATAHASLDGLDGPYADLDEALDSLATNAGSCVYYYTGQYRVPTLGLDGLLDASGAVQGLHSLTLSLDTGVVNRGTFAFEPPL